MIHLSLRTSNAGEANPTNVGGDPRRAEGCLVQRNTEVTRAEQATISGKLESSAQSGVTSESAAVTSTNGSLDGETELNQGNGSRRR